MIKGLFTFYSHIISLHISDIYLLSIVEFQFSKKNDGLVFVRLCNAFFYAHVFIIITTRTTKKNPLRFFTAERKKSNRYKSKNFSPLQLCCFIDPFWWDRDREGEWVKQKKEEKKMLMICKYIIRNDSRQLQQQQQQRLWQSFFC